MGAMGVRNGTPKLFRAKAWHSMIYVRAASPRNPNAAPATMKRSVATLMNIPISKFGSVKEATAVTAMMITKMGLTIDAVTAASPIRSAPTMPIVGPMGEGMRIPASRMSSKPRYITKTSMYSGKGMGSRAAAIAIMRAEGTISGW